MRFGEIFQGSDRSTSIDDPILVTILIIYSTDLTDVSLNAMDGVNPQRKDYFNPIDWVGIIKGLLIMGYLEFLSVFSLRFLEKPSIKANISKKI